MEEKKGLAADNPNWGQIVCRCETVTEAQVVEAIRRGARTVSGVKSYVRAGMGRCQGGFCTPRVVEILARELGVSPLEITRHGGNSRLLSDEIKAPLLSGGSK
jgi:glycerol-3-phosphate dehydrogenase